MHSKPLGLGVGWRPELAWAIDQRQDLGFVEVLAEDLNPQQSLPAPLQRLRNRGLPIILHGVSLSLGGAEPPAPKRLARLAELADNLGSPLVSEHLSFVRAAGFESGHLLPMPLTRECVQVVIENVRTAKTALPVPLAIENISTLFEWPHAELDEAAFLTEVLEQADVQLLLDIENVYANALNFNRDPLSFLERIPLERIAYVHIAGGQQRGELYHDTHTVAIAQPVFDLLEELSARTEIPGVMLERDDNFPFDREFHQELDAIWAAVERGNRRRLQRAFSPRRAHCKEVS